MKTSSGKEVITIPANTRTSHWRSPSGSHAGSFRPNGSVLAIGPVPTSKNPEAWESSDPPVAARLFVGFNVGPRAVWSVEDLVPLVRRVREQQGHKADASFLLQKGIYTSEKDGSVVEEDGAQVIVLDLDGTPEKKFKREMVELGETIATVLEQEAVILEMQKGGITTSTVGIVPVEGA